MIYFGPGRSKDLYSYEQPSQARAVKTMNDGLYWFTFVASVFAWTSLLPDPYAFNHVGLWKVLSHNERVRSTKYWHHAFKIRSVFSHIITLAFAFVVCTFLFWLHYAPNSYDDNYENYVLYGSIVAALACVLFLHYASAGVVSLALGWLLAVHYGLTGKVIWHWIFSGFVALVVAAGVAYAASSYLLTKIVAYFQYPLAVAFTGAFSVVVLEHGNVRSFTQSGIRDKNIWPTITGMGILFVLYCVLQWSYATRSLCGNTSVQDHYDLPEEVKKEQEQERKKREKASDDTPLVPPSSKATPLWGSVEDSTETLAVQSDED